MIACRQLVGDWGNCAAGGYFDTDEEKARDFERRGLAYRYRAPTLKYETKVIVPGATPGTEAPRVSARLPFRNVPNSDEEPAALAAVRRATSAVSDVQEQGDSDSRGRGRRKGSDTE